MIRIGDLICEIDELGFEDRLPAVPKLTGNLVVPLRRVFEDALSDFVSQIQTPKLRISFFQVVYDSERLQVVLETAMFRHECVHGVLPRVTERCMPEVVRQRDRLGQVLVELKKARRRSCDQRCLERMGQPRSVVVAFMIDEDLRLVFEPAERGAVDNAIAVTLKSGSEWVLRFVVASAS